MCKENIAKFNNNDNIKLFCAGMISEKNKFNNLKEKSYVFIPFVLESHGGTLRKLKNVFNYISKLKGSRTNKDVNIIKNNFYIKLSIYIKKLIIQSIIKNHYND